MLTVQMLSQNPVLSGLTDAQRAAIAEMSQNDENTVIGARIGELHGRYDADILAVTGVAKNAGEKSYEYAKRVLSGLKTQAGSSAELQTKLDAANAKVAELNEKIAKGEGDATLRQQLKDTKAQVTQLQGQLQAKEAAYNAEKSKLESEIKTTHINHAFEAATAGLKFKDGISANIQAVLLNSAKSEILAKGTPDFIDKDGTKVLVFRDNNGLIMNNPKNNMNPYTMQDFVMETSLKEVIDTGRQQSGGGTGNFGGFGGSGSGVTLDFTNVRTQVEADKLITRHLLAEGLTRDSQEFAQKSLEIRNENNISQLPIR